MNRMSVCRCDIKPANCLFRSSVRHLYLVDFGLSCQLPCSVLGHEVYTANYRAPDLFQNRTVKCSLGTLTDAFATGGTLFEVASSRKLYRTGQHMALEMQCSLRIGFAPCGAAWATVPEDCRYLIHRLCMPQAKKRVWPTKAELICMIITVWCSMWIHYHSHVVVQKNEGYAV